jgi:hypothetical protein
LQNACLLNAKKLPDELERYLHESFRVMKLSAMYMTAMRHVQRGDEVDDVNSYRVIPKHGEERRSSFMAMRM